MSAELYGFEADRVQTANLNFEIRPRVPELRPVKVKEFSKKLLDLKQATRCKESL